MRKNLVAKGNSVFDFSSDAFVDSGYTDVSTYVSLFAYDEKVCEIVNVKGKDNARNIFDVYFTNPKGTSSRFCDFMFSEMVAEFLRQYHLMNVVKRASKFAKFQTWLEFIKTSPKICYDKDTKKLYVFSEGHGCWFDVDEEGKA